MIYPIFVYGTLRSEASYHHLISKWIITIKKAYTKGSLYHYAIDDEFGWYPYLTEGDDVVCGELISFTDIDRVLSITDDFEDNGIVFQRIVHPVFDEENTMYNAWVYFIIKGFEKKEKYIKDGDWIKEVRNGNYLFHKGYP
ncbi:MAG: gamma-glutamylcyclotransferase [Spirochaetota bacterium]|nr:gamma-glutamylcyclotransferase [Spirochaetota bacterium]